MEGWFYSLVEITNGVLPWRHLSYSDLEAVSSSHPPLCGAPTHS